MQLKVEALIAKHMRSLGASEVALSSISSADLWRQSGRLDAREKEFFMLKDRGETELLLAPTHEEEITRLVASVVHSHRDLPVRLYQITRKYRDELRPRQGLLRGREFVMKDLYTFDATAKGAKETYEAVRRAYSAFLDELRVPYFVAEADSGNMGGTLSHEYHFASEAGEDTLLQCSACGHVVNQEVLGASETSNRSGGCRKCHEGHLSPVKAIEIGHTFHLGKRYSIPLDARFKTSSGAIEHIEMGCHGIGVTRLIGAIATKLADDKGLNWPVSIAPFSMVVLYSEGNADAALEQCREMQTEGLDVAFDDRDKSIGWKLQDADLIGYPLIVVFGKRFAKEKLVEVQCRQRGLKEHVSLAALRETVQTLFADL